MIKQSLSRYTLYYFIKNFLLKVKNKLEKKPKARIICNWKYYDI